MDNLNAMTFGQIAAFAKCAPDPVQFYRDTMVQIGEELSSVVKEELTSRETRLKAMKAETKFLAISFDR